VKVGDLARYKHRESSFWTGIVVEVYVPEWEENKSINYVKIIWNQDPSCHGLIRADLMEVISEGR